VTPLVVIPDAEQTPGLLDRSRPYVEGQLRAVGLMRHATSEGRAAVLLTVDLPDGTQVVAQTTWRLFDAAARALAVTPIVAEEVTGP